MGCIISGSSLCLLGRGPEFNSWDKNPMRGGFYPLSLIMACVCDRPKSFSIICLARSVVNSNNRHSMRL